MNMNGYKMIYLEWSHDLQYGIRLAIRTGRRNGEIKMITCTKKKLSPKVNVKLSVAAGANKCFRPTSKHCAAVIWLRYGEKHYPVNQSKNCTMLIDL